MSDQVLCKNRYGNKVFLHKNVEHGFDLETDGRVYLDPLLARELATKLVEFADKHEGHRSRPFGEEWVDRKVEESERGKR